TVVNNNGSVGQVGTVISSAKETVTGWVSNLGSGIKNSLNNVNAKVSSYRETVSSKVSEVIEDTSNLFKKTSAYVSKKATNLWNKATEWLYDTTIQVGAVLKESAATISKGARSLWSNVTDCWEQMGNWWCNDVLPWIENATNTVWGVLKSVGATIAVAVQSLVEGILQFGEALVDFTTIVGAVGASAITGLIDGGQAIYGAITGNEWSSITKKMWGKTKGFVSTQYVKGWADSLYENTGYGKWLAENAYGFNIVRDVGTGIGYIAGIIALTIATCGIGGAIYGVTAPAGTTVAATVSSTAVTTISIGSVNASITVGALISGGIATAAGIGKNTSVAWNDGASSLGGLVYGGAMGLWEGLEMLFGYTVNSLDLGISKGLKRQVINSLSHILLDTMDGGTAGFISPIMKMIYNPNETNLEQIMYSVNYDSNGNRINNKTWDDLNFTEKYRAMFIYNGGMESVLTGAMSAGVVSFVSEVPDVFKEATGHTLLQTIFGSSKKSKEAKNMPEQIKSIDIANYRDLEKDILDIINIHDKKYGFGDALMRLNKFIDPESSHYKNYKLITGMNGARSILEMYTPEQIKQGLESLCNARPNVSGALNGRSDRIADMPEFFRSTGESYGVDQAAIEKLCIYEYKGKQYSYREVTELVNDAIKNGDVPPQIKKIGTPEYLVLKNNLMQIGFDNGAASVILSSINDAGACSYASVCNQIFYHFKDNPDLFQQFFDYPMYNITDGVKSLNSSKLLLDLYLYANDTRNGGKFFINGDKINPKFLSDKVDIFGRPLLKAEDQVYMLTSNGVNEQALSGFLSSKNTNLKLESELFMNNYSKIIYSEEDFKYITSELIKEINEGKSVDLTFFYYPKESDKVINMISTNKSSYPNVATSSWNEGFGHATTVTGIDANGFFVSSWGREYIIHFDDLRNGGRFVISTLDVRLK
ncbi:MAG: hypothetical protein PHC56_12075, partial [Herbinix sp.]|nr:hypothetical protein [Herbinix sp.]